MDISVQFLSHINVALEKSPVVQKMFSDFSVSDTRAKDKKAEIPSLFSLSQQVLIRPDVEEIHDISRTGTDPSIQKRVLNSAKKFSEWTHIRKMCSDEAVKNNSKEFIGRIHLGIKSNENELLAHFFSEMVKDYTDQEKTAIIRLKRQVLPYKQQGSDLIKAGMEKVIDIIIKIVTNRYVRFAAALIAAYYTWMLCWKVVVLAQHLAIFKGLPLLINHAPLPIIKIINVVISIFKTIFYYPLTTFLGALGVSVVISKICPPLDRWVFRPISNAVFEIGFFWWKLIFRIINATSFVFNYISKTSLAIGEKMDQVNRAWRDLRMGHEMVQAREKWIELYQAERTKIRAEIEEAYRQQETAQEAIGVG